MNAPMDTLGFAQGFEEAGFDPRQARALASALGRTFEAAREDLVTGDTLKAEMADLKAEIRTDMAELRTEIHKDMADLRIELHRDMSELKSGVEKSIAELKSGVEKSIAEVKSGVEKSIAEVKSGVEKSIADLRVELTREIAAVGRDVSGRLWTTVTIIAGVATAVSATVGAAVALILKAKGL